MKLLVLTCIYAAMTYSFLRTCMEQKVPRAFAFLVAALWPLLLTWSVASDIFQGIKELASRK